MHAAGYRNFRLPNLPDLALTPEFKKQSDVNQRNAHDVTIHFNQMLKEGVAGLGDEHKGLSLEIFDVYAIFNDVYEGAGDYLYEQTHFEKEKLATFMTDQEEYHIDHKDHTSDGAGYMFWDHVHPSMRLHSLLGEALLTHCKDAFDFKMTGWGYACS